MNLARRVSRLESWFLPSEPIVLEMRDGSTRKIEGRGDIALRLVGLAARGERTPELALVAESVSASEPGGGRLVELTRSLLLQKGENEQC